MITDGLGPRLELLQEEYVLVQAWKKTATYIRYHNWFSDTLELDRTAINLPRFLGELSEQLKTPDKWNNTPLRIVPSPKSQQWRVSPDKNCWEPAGKLKTEAPIRPLAHVSLKDQVAATAVMMCLADRVETIQGDPRNSITDPKARVKVISYGNRLFCDTVNEKMQHRWGSGKLYRAYYQDYRSFLTRPETVAEEITSDDGNRVIIVHSDLCQFYDRVRTGLLVQKLKVLQGPDDDPDFFTFANRLFNWNWHNKDSWEIKAYTTQTGLDDFSNVALPQGLVAAGFFANVVLLDFDESLRNSCGKEIVPGLCIHDVCRYVDDLRIVLTIHQKVTLDEIEQLITNWLQELLNHCAKGLKPSKDKTKAATFGRDERPLVRQSRKMARIQGAISGGFDAIGGEEILDAVQGLIRSQQRYTKHRIEEHGWSFSPIPDVRDATVERFAAARFRSTYRSLRPLLADHEDIESLSDEDIDEELTSRRCIARTQDELDDEARSFALGLIERWIEDPSNVRLLRIGLDLWPAADVVNGVLGLLRPFTKSGGPRGTRRRVAWYCLSEIFRAGATETGLVEDGESLPKKIDIDAYHKVLRDEAIRLLTLPAASLPWYLRQQVLLFLASNEPSETSIMRTGRNAETKHYCELIRFRRGEGDKFTDAAFATFAILTRRSFASKRATLDLVLPKMTCRRLEQIAERDPSFALEVCESNPELCKEIAPRLRDDLCLKMNTGIEGWKSLAEVVLKGKPNGPLRNELAMLRFATAFLKEIHKNGEVEVVTPVNVHLQVEKIKDLHSEEGILRIVPSRVMPVGSMYSPPPWCPNNEHWRFQLGYLLRFILTAHQDFTKVVRPPHWREEKPSYRASESHWYQRLYGLFNGHKAFGDDWLPISDWTEQLLFALLNWPGCRVSDIADKIRGGIPDICDFIDCRLKELDSKRDPSPFLFLPIRAPWPDCSCDSRPLRACVVQTVTPTSGELTSAANDGDLTLSNRTIRRKHRNHLSAALAAVQQMLALRETHLGREGRLDWLILPELSVHPNDIKTHLVPFARAHKTIILAGLTYERLFADQPLINSALWIIPVWSKSYGLQVHTRRQGKYHLAAPEKKFNAAGEVVMGFRPCQWLVGYDWSRNKNDRPLWLTASICYDSTDLSLAADLRHRSDVFAIPALNKDVKTFDQMALALHYHMFQYVIVANNGEFGGSNSYAPYNDAFKRQVFHLHGQPQASVAFLEIDKIGDFLQRKDNNPTSCPWKYPPAGM